MPRASEKSQCCMEAIQTLTRRVVALERHHDDMQENLLSFDDKFDSLISHCMRQVDDVREDLEQRCKPMKRMKAMKKTMKKTMKRATIATESKRAKALVLAGYKNMTEAGQSDDKVLLYPKDHWRAACEQARWELNLKGFVPIGGKTVAGKAFHAKAKEIYNFYKEYTQQQQQQQQ